MRKFIDTQFVSLIRESAKQSVLDFEWEQAYEEFASLVFATKASCTKDVYHNSLCYAKAELDFLRSQSDCRKKRKQAMLIL